MSLLPPFKFGLWNTWILMLYFPLHPLIMLATDKAVGTGQIFKKMDAVPYEPHEKMAYHIFMVIMIFLVAYSLFLPLQLGTAWFSAGLALYLFGLAIFVIAVANVATTPQGQIFTKGLYRYSRHPMYISILIINTGIGVACASWIFLLFSLIILVLQRPQALAEERGCLAAYGNKYREYLHRTPRWIGLLKSR